MLWRGGREGDKRGEAAVRTSWGLLAAAGVLKLRELKALTGWTWRMEAGFFSSPAQFVESLPLVPLSVSLNASLIVFDFFQIISFSVPLLILEPPSLSLSAELPAPLPWLCLSLSFSLTSSKCAQYWCFSLHHGPCDAFPPFSSLLCLPPFICQRFSVVFSPQVYALSCTQMYRYTSGFTELFWRQRPILIFILKLMENICFIIQNL